ncbi:hypothetical protein FA13DRAFT_1815372 [Coprinellus micaceus]|uniref:RRM domain-containing protein n=1 Tax=Coprinellus micaceus TaxID=71717 RepID=A0A4Y7T4X6_COPMI|nr:hypothetical protein FA13DRAFT_1815372 [Coprinellus micaceus]
MEEEEVARGRRSRVLPFRGPEGAERGIPAKYSHNPNVVEPDKRQSTDEQGRIRAQQVAAVARELERREEEERLRKEEERRQEEERLEQERLAREHLERLDAERKERERAEAERIARRARGSLSATSRGKGQETEGEGGEVGPRAREGPSGTGGKTPTRSQSHSAVRRPGLEPRYTSDLVSDVQRIVPGFDLCKVVIRNLPTDASDKEIVNVFKEQGLDDTMFKLLEEEAEAMAVGLNELEFRDNLLTFEVEDNTAWGSMKSSSEADTNTLTFFWSAPSVVMIATYATVEEARRKAQQLNRRQFGGRTIIANMNQRPNGPAAKFWVEASVKIGGLPPGTEPFDIHTMAGTIQVRPIKSNNYNGTTFLEQLKVYLRLDGYESLKRAADRLNRGMPNWPKIRVLEQHQYCISISNAQYRAQKAQWDSMTETARGKKAFIRINERRNGQVFVNVEGSEEKEVGELKVRVESLVAGERLGSGDIGTAPMTHAAKALFDQLRSLLVANRCLRHYISSAASSDTFPLVCMGNEATCNTPISVPIIHRYLTTASGSATLVDAVFASYVQMNSKRFKYCTTPDCTQIYQCDTEAHEGMYMRAEEGPK